MNHKTIDKPTIKRSENPKKTQIRKAAYQVMNELGFDAASYSEIAKHSGYGRPLVQMYFPKKDQFILDMTEDSIDLIFEILQDQGDLVGTAYENTLRIAQAYFSLFFRDKKSIRLTREILAHRSILKSVFDLYQLKVIAMGFDADQKDISIATLKALGGVEELLMDEIDKGVRLDPSDITCQLLAAMKVFLADCSYRSAYAEMKEYLLPDRMIGEIVSVVEETILSLPPAESDQTQPEIRSVA